jgi:molybdopterin adenylyltransferase
VRPPRIAVLTVSDRVARGEREDRSGPEIVRWARANGWPIAAQAAVPDETVEIARTLIAWADAGTADVILTTGGTGLAPRDVTPEATRAVLEREAPGIAEWLRAAGLAQTPMAALGRGIAGTRGRTLIVNLPGHPRAVADGLARLAAVLPHAVELLRGEPVEHEPVAAPGRTGGAAATSPPPAPRTGPKTP